MCDETIDVSCKQQLKHSTKIYYPDEDIHPSMRKCRAYMDHPQQFATFLSYFVQFTCEVHRDYFGQGHILSPSVCLNDSFLPFLGNGQSITVYNYSVVENPFIAPTRLRLEHAENLFLMRKYLPLPEPKARETERERFYVCPRT